MTVSNGSAAAFRALEPVPGALFLLERPAADPVAFLTRATVSVLGTAAFFRPRAGVEARADPEAGSCSGGSLSLESSTAGAVSLGLSTRGCFRALGLGDSFTGPLAVADCACDCRVRLRVEVGGGDCQITIVSSAHIRDDGFSLLHYEHWP